MSTLKPIKFELSSPLSVHQEKELAGSLKTLDRWFNGLEISKAQLLGYAVLIGHELNRMKDALPHGEFEKLVEEKYKLPKTTQHRWRDHSEAFVTKFNLLREQGKSPTVGLLKSPFSGKKSFNRKEQKLILQITPEIMDRKGMVQFIEDVKLISEPDDVGGFHPSKEKLAQWLKSLDEKTVASFPSLASVKFEDLSPKLQLQFKKWLAAQGPRITVSKQAEVAKENCDHLNKDLVAAIRGKWVLLLEQDDFELLLQNANKFLDRLQAADRNKSAARAVSQAAEKTKLNH